MKTFFYYLDGIRVSGTTTMIPSSEIDQLEVITGGLPAKFGSPSIDLKEK